MYDVGVIEMKIKRLDIQAVLEVLINSVRR